MAGAGRFRADYAKDFRSLANSHEWGAKLAGWLAVLAV
jgi:hypothetical protein